MGKFILTLPWAPVWWMSSKVLDAVAKTPNILLELKIYTVVAD